MKFIRFIKLIIILFSAVFIGCNKSRQKQKVPRDVSEVRLKKVPDATKSFSLLRTVPRPKKIGKHDILGKVIETHIVGSARDVVQVASPLSRFVVSLETSEGVKKIAVHSIAE